jgi:HK97 family phage portal protein
LALRDALRAFFSPAPGMEPPYIPLGEVVHERGLTADDLWGPSAGAWRDTQAAAGERVDGETALRSIAVQAAVRLLVNDIKSLPADTLRRQGQERTDAPRPTWIDDPNPMNPNVTWEDHIGQVVAAMLTDGNNFTRCFPNRFRPEGLEALDPTTVDVDTFRGRTVYPVKGEGNLTPAEIVHIPWMLLPGKARGLNPIEAAKHGLSIALASDQYVGSYFRDGAVLSGVIEFPLGVEPTKEQVNQIKSDFKRKHQGSRNSFAVGGLTNGATYKPFEVSNRDAQLLELRDQIVEEVARLFGIPPHMLGSQKPGAVGYASVEQRSIDYVTHAVLPIVKRIEVAYSRLMRGQQTYLKFNVNGLLRGDLAARAAFYSTMLESKVIRRDEVRALEDLPFDSEGVGYLETPNNNAPEPPAEPQEPAA